MTESDEWWPFTEAAGFLTMTEPELAQHVLAGTLRFRVRKAVTSPQVVVEDVQLCVEDVHHFHATRWLAVAGRARANELLNRAALKFRQHPTRTSPGVRGQGRRTQESR